MDSILDELERAERAKSIFNVRDYGSITDNNIFSKGDFRCDYCGKTYNIRDLHLSAESDHTYENTVTTFGRPAIKSSQNIYTVKLCTRCNKIHSIAGWVHCIVALLSIVIAIYVSWEEGASFDHYIFPICIAVIIAQIIRFVDWFFIKIIFDVRRKPLK